MWSQSERLDEVDPELLAAMEDIENEEWDDDKNEEGFISDDFIQQAIDDKGPVNEFDFDQHIRNLLKAREEKEKSNVELTEDRYAEEIRVDPDVDYWTVQRGRGGRGGGRSHHDG